VISKNPIVYSSSKLISHFFLALFVYGSCSCHPNHRSNMRFLISDFGFSAQDLDSDAVVISYQGRGTPKYRAPELLRSTPTVCRRSDTWSVACILFKVATTNKRFAFQSDREVTQFDLHPHWPIPQLNADDNVNLLQETLCPRKGILLPLWEQINDIFESCFTRLPQDRASVFEMKERFDSIWEILMGDSSQH